MASEIGASPANGDAVNVPDAGAKDPSYYFPLCKATFKEDWETAEAFLKENPESVSVKLSKKLKTTLHMAIGMGIGTSFVEKLVESMRPEDVVLMDEYGDTALNLVAVAGDVRVARVLVKMNPRLPYMKNKKGNFPLHRAAKNSHRDLFCYLLGVTKDDVHPNPYIGDAGVELLIDVIDSEFLDVAMELIQRYPHMAQTKLSDGRSALLQTAMKPSLFSSGCVFNFWQRLAYANFAVVRSICSDSTLPKCDVENPIQDSQQQTVSKRHLLEVNNSKLVAKKSHNWGSKLFRFLAPEGIEEIIDQKLINKQAIELVRCLCQKISQVNNEETYTSMYEAPLFEAARWDIPEMIEEIVEAFPTAIWCRNEFRETWLHVAIKQRSEKVFNYYFSSKYKLALVRKLDKDGNNVFHVAGKLAPIDKLALLPGEALQMQRELQWFKTIEMNLPHRYREYKNKKSETPAIIFAREHRSLAVKGEEWMKGTSETCMIVATLVAAVTFAAAITVPGGNQDSGMPIFNGRSFFKVFAASNAVSVFTSLASLLLFLSIASSRYDLEDFYYVLPKKLVLGLITLFISISCMTIAFSSTIYLLFGISHAWAIVALVGSACIPISLLLGLQLSFLPSVIASTYTAGFIANKKKQKTT